jgi:uncharacterized protein (TIGR02266 family)
MLAVAQDTRVGDRQLTSMRIKLKYPDVETFIQKYAVNISRGGIFIATRTPKPVGTSLKFEFVLAAGENGVSIIRGEGQVLWTREFDPTQPSKAHGMGVKFTRLDAESQAIVDRALAFRAQQSEKAAERAAESSGPVATATATAAPITSPAPVTDDPPTVPRGTPPPTVAPPEAKTPPASESGPVTVPEIPPVATETAAPAAVPPLVPPMQVPILGRAPDEVTRPLPVDPRTPAPNEIALAMGRTKEDVTRPIDVEDERTKETKLPRATPPPLPAAAAAGGVALAQPRVKIAVEHDPSREIRIRGTSRDGAIAELDAIAKEWGVSPEKIERILKRRRPRMVEATAELERLLRKPARAPVPTKQEAMAGLRELLQRRSPVLEIDRTPRPADEIEPADDDEKQPPIKKVR